MKPKQNHCYGHTPQIQKGAKTSNSGVERMPFVTGSQQLSICFQCNFLSPAVPSIQLLCELLQLSPVPLQLFPLSSFFAWLSVLFEGSLPSSVVAHDYLNWDCCSFPLVLSSIRPSWKFCKSFDPYGLYFFLDLLGMGSLAACRMPGRNRVQITCNTSRAYHVQVSCYVPLGTEGQLSY